MKACRTFALLLGAILLGTAAQPAIAQTNLAPAALQREYDQFIAKFRGALKANDGAAVTALTKFPFIWNERRDAADFRKNIYAKVFTPKTRACVARAKGVYDRDGEGNHNYSVFCGQHIFLFTKTPNGFRFAEIGVND